MQNARITTSAVLRFAMRVKLIFIERDFSGKDLSTREEVLYGESAKSLTRSHVARLIARHHPELKHAGGVWLLDASETRHKWYVQTEKLGPNKWLTVYADPLPEPTVQE
jgi:hypothetical protein